MFQKVKNTKVNVKYRSYDYVVVGRDHKYGYNGKEENDELGLSWLDLGARNHDPSLGRFMNLDPIAEDYYFQSTYAFAANNPIYFIDINGEGVQTDYKMSQNGKVTRVDENDGTENDPTDTLYATDSNDEIDTNNSITINTKGFLAEFSNTETPRVPGNSSASINLTTGGDSALNDLTKFYEFAVQNTVSGPNYKGIEFAINIFKVTSSVDGKRSVMGLIHTSHKSYKVDSFVGQAHLFGFNVENRDYLFSAHSHKGGGRTPSVPDPDEGTLGDMGVARPSAHRYYYLSRWIYTPKGGRIQTATTLIQYQYKQKAFYPSRTIYWSGELHNVVNSKYTLNSYIKKWAGL